MVRPRLRGGEQHRHRPSLGHPEHHSTFRSDGVHHGSSVIHPSLQRGKPVLRVASAQAFGFCGLVPSEYSSGERTRRGRITKAGNTHIRRQLVESAWAYRYHPGVTDRMRRRQDGLPRETVARAWGAQLRLCSRFRRLASRKESESVVATAIARELAGFLWAEMTA